jgi:hypothetical protein
MTLAEEAQRYLAVVEVFRREGCEPRWRAETWSKQDRPSNPTFASQDSTKGRTT